MVCSSNWPGHSPLKAETPVQVRHRSPPRCFRLSGRTSAFHAEKTGSNPVSITTYYSGVQLNWQSSGLQNRRLGVRFALPLPYWDVAKRLRHRSLKPASMVRIHPSQPYGERTRKVRDALAKRCVLPKQHWVRVLRSPPHGSVSIVGDCSGL